MSQGKSVKDNNKFNIDKVLFNHLNLHESLLNAIIKLEWQYATPIQREILPHSLMGLDVTGKAQTGTGKTAAFLISIINHCLNKELRKHSKGSPRTCILPHVNLQFKLEKIQSNKYIFKIKNSCFLRRYRLQQAVKKLEFKKVDILVATPGNY